MRALALIACSITAFFLQLPQLTAATKTPMMIVVDRSLSMRRTDPDHFASDAVQLALATIRTQKDFAIVGFAEKSKLIIPWSSVENHFDRDRIRDQFLPDRTLPYERGGTYYSTSLGKAYEELNRINAPAGSRVLFFTDGNPSDESRDIEAVGARYADREWIIDGLVLIRDGDISNELRNLTIATGGAYTEINNPENLVERFNTLTIQENDYFTLDIRQTSRDEQKAVNILPGTIHLVWITVRDQQERGRLQNLWRGEQRVDIDSLDKTYRHPEGGIKETNVDIVHITDPEVGRYQAEYSGDPRAVFINISLPLETSVTAIPKTVDEYEQIDLKMQVRALTNIDEIIPFVSQQGKVTVRIVDQATGEEFTTAELTPSVAGEVVNFTGSIACPWPESESRSEPRQFLFHHDLTLVEDWTLRKTVATTVNPYIGPPLPVLHWDDLEKDQTIPVGIFWNDSQPTRINATYKIDNPPAEDIAIDLPPANGFTPDTPWIIQATAVTGSFGKQAVGEHRYPITGTFALDRLQHTLPTVELSALVYPWLGTTTVTVDMEGNSPLLEWTPVVDGLPEQPLKANSFEGTGPDGTPVQITYNEQGRFAIQAPTTMPPGAVRAETQVQYGVLAERPIEIVAAYEPPTANFSWPTNSTQKELVMAERSFSKLAPIELDMTEGLPGTIEVTIGDFTGSQHGDLLSGSYDMKIEATPNRIAPDIDPKIAVSVYRGSDLHSDTYVGDITVTYTADNGAQHVTTHTLHVPIVAASE